MMKALEILQNGPTQEIEQAVSRLSGIFRVEARTMPETTYTTAELQELFDYLFKLIMENHGA